MQKYSKRIFAVFYV